MEASGNNSGKERWASSAHNNASKPPIIKPPPIPSGVKAAAQNSPQASALPEKPYEYRPSALLTVEELERFKNLLVFAKSTVEGYYTGRHRSPFRGSSSEFADYKEYVAGDDLSHLDWRAYGRTRRLYVRQFEEETDMMVYLMVDTSASMRYAGEKRQPKFFLAAKIAAALAYLMIKQGDKVSLTLFSDKVNQFLPPGGTRRHMHRLVTELERVRPASTTGISNALTECAGIFKKRGRLIVLSDFLDDNDKLFETLGQFLHRKFEVLLLHVVDPDEMNLPDFTVAKFVDMETKEEVQVDPDEIRTSYRQNVKQAIDDLAREADLRQIQHTLVDTRNPYLTAIEAYLGFRGINNVLAK